MIHILNEYHIRNTQLSFGISPSELIMRILNIILGIPTRDTKNIKNNLS